MKYKFQLIILMAISLFVAGCSTTGGINPQTLIQANAQVQTLLEQYPNANLDITYYSINESSQLEEEYNSICSKEFTQKALYRFSLQDETQGLDVVGYLNPTEQTVECVSREGRENNTNSNTQNNESSTSGNDTSTIVNSTTEEVSLYFDVEAEYEGIEPTQEQRELLEELRELTNNFNSTFKLEFEIEVDEGEVSSQEEGIVGSQEILDAWGELLSQITTQVENSTAQEIEVSVEVAKKRVEEGDDGGNSFEIKVESGDSNREDDEKDENKSEEIDVDIDIELTINEEEQSSRAEIEINDREEVMEFDTTSPEEIKQKIANEFNLEYGVVASNTEVEYEYNDDKEEKEDSEEEIEVDITNLKLSPSTGVEPGQAVNANVKVENELETKIEKVEIKILIPELNIEATSYLYDINEYGEVTSEDMYLGVSRDSQAGIYDADVIITDFNNKEELERESFDFVVLERDDSNDNDLVISNPNLVELDNESEKSFDITIGNPSSISKAISIVPENVNWAEIETDPTFGMIQSGEDRTFSINLNLNSQNISGDKSLKLNIKNNEIIVEQIEVLVRTNN